MVPPHFNGKNYNFDFFVMSNESNACESTLRGKVAKQHTRCCQLILMEIIITMMIGGKVKVMYVKVKVNLNRKLATS